MGLGVCQESFGEKNAKKKSLLQNARNKGVLGLQLTLLFQAQVVKVCTLAEVTGAEKSPPTPTRCKQQVSRRQPRTFQSRPPLSCSAACIGWPVRVVSADWPSRDLFKMLPLW